MHKYRATIEFESDEPMNMELIDVVTLGLFVAVDDPSNEEGDGLHWSGKNVVVKITGVPPTKAEWAIVDSEGGVCERFATFDEAEKALLGYDDVWVQHVPEPT